MVILGQEVVVPSYGVGRVTSIGKEIGGKPSFIGVTPFVAGYEMKFDYDNVKKISDLNVYQFDDGVAINVKSIVAIDEIRFVEASINEHSDWNAGEHYYQILFQTPNFKLTRYFSYNKKEDIIKERNKLIQFWKSAI